MATPCGGAACSVGIETPGSHRDDETGSTRNKRAYNVLGYDPFIPNLQRITPSTQTLIHIFHVTFLCMLYLINNLDKHAVRDATAKDRDLNETEDADFSLTNGIHKMNCS